MANPCCSFANLSLQANPLVVAVVNEVALCFSLWFHHTTILLMPTLLVANLSLQVDPLVVAVGNEAVLRARFEDAAFFYAQDTATTLEQLR